MTNAKMSFGLNSRSLLNSYMARNEPRNTTGITIKSLAYHLIHEGPILSLCKM